MRGRGWRYLLVAAFSCSKASVPSNLPRFCAISKAVSPLSRVMLASVPAASNMLMTSGTEPSAAECRAVLPRRPSAFGSAPTLSKRMTFLDFPLLAAWCKGGLELPFTFGSAPASIKGICSQSCRRLLQYAKESFPPHLERLGLRHL